jgi:bacillaene synthase trans-acting acyltransferase
LILNKFGEDMTDILDLSVSKNIFKNTNKSVVFMYSGQGSQYYGMARSLYEENSIFRQSMESLDKIVKGVVGRSVIRELYFSGKTLSHSFDQLILTHPAIFMVEYSLTEMLMNDGIRPDEIIGSSLGLYTCLSVAEAIKPEEMLEFIIRQAMIIEQNCRCGGMIAILDDYRLFCNMPVMYNNAELISISHDNHFVISGHIEGIDIVECFLEENKITYFRLPVSYGFHSKNIDPAYEKLLKLAEKITIKQSRFDIYSIKGTHRLKKIQSEFLWDIVRESIEFPTILQSFNNDEFNVFIDMGPAGTLANIAKGIIKKDTHLFSIISQFNTEQKNIENIKKYINSRL